MTGLIEQRNTLFLDIVQTKSFSLPKGRSSVLLRHTFVFHFHCILHQYLNYEHFYNDQYKATAGINDKDSR